MSNVDLPGNLRRSLVVGAALLVALGLLIAFFAYYNRTTAVVVMIPDGFQGDIPIEFVDAKAERVEGATILDGTSGVLRVPRSSGAFELWTKIVSARTRSGKAVPVDSTVPFPDDLIAIRGPRDRGGRLVLVVGTKRDFTSNSAPTVVGR